MFRKGDFQRVQLLGSGKKHTKIYKALHKQTQKFYAIKQIQAKSMEKLNQYKQEAVQLMKVQNHPNVIKFFGYYFSQTMYNAFRLNLVTEFMDNTMNMENIYRKRKKNSQLWKEKELVIMYCSIISTCAFLQNIGICHRDIKPANIFFLPNGQLKLIDFGQSKDYFYDIEDDEKADYTLATIRGTPQYLSPILWKAHVIDGQSRYAKHNIYKSDVFSTGLVLFQMASMNEVSGFNSKTRDINGEELIKQNIKILQKKYSPAFTQLLDLLLRFDEADRPSYCQIEQMFLNKQLGCKETGKPCNQYIKYYNQHFNNLTKTQVNTSTTVGISSHLNSLRQKSNKQQKFEEESLEEKQKSRYVSKQKQKEKEKEKERDKDKEREREKQREKPRKHLNHYKDSTLILNQNCYWFQFGGIGIGRFNINKLKWKIEYNQFKTSKFPQHLVAVYVPDSKAYYLLGGPQDHNFRIFHNRKLQLSRVQMPGIRDLFPALHYNKKIYLFGGYNNIQRTQMSSCMVFDIPTQRWDEIASMKVPRSFAACCKINENEILVFGGYNKQQKTLNSIQKYNIKFDTFELLELKLPIALRRFMVAKISNNVAIVFGGLTKDSLESQRVFKLNYQNMEFIQLQSLEKGGAIENQILVDEEGHFHLFLEHANGTSPHAHIKYVYDPNHEKYATKME